MVLNLTIFINKGNKMHIVSGELRKAPYVQSGIGKDGQSVLFIVELSEMTKNRQTGEKQYTNYRASLFAKGGQIDYYNSVLVEGNFIVVSGEKLTIDVSQCGQYTKLNMENARLNNAGYIGQSQAQVQPQQQAPQQGGFAPQPQQQQQGGFAPQQQGGFNPNGGHAPQQ